MVAILSYEEAARMAQLEAAIVMQHDLSAFLDVAWRFPKLSMENICLILLQNPNAVEINTESEWRQCCYQLKSDAGAITLMVEKHNVVYLYDISQTDGKRTEPVPNPGQAYDALIKTLGKEPITLEQTKNRIAYYDASGHIWCVSAKANTDARFYSIITYLITQALEGKSQIESMSAGDMAAYMLCQKYGISTQYIHMTNLQATLYRMTDDTLRRNTIYAAMDCLEAEVFKDLWAYYSDRMMERKLEKDREADILAKAQEAKKKEEEARIQALVEQRVQQITAEMQRPPEKKGLLGFWKRGENGK